jgi:hypothetical protein
VWCNNTQYSIPTTPFTPALSTCAHYAAGCVSLVYAPDDAPYTDIIKVGSSVTVS